MLFYKNITNIKKNPKIYSNIIIKIKNINYIQFINISYKIDNCISKK